MKAMVTTCITRFRAITYWKGIYTPYTGLLEQGGKDVREQRVLPALAVQAMTLLLNATHETIKFRVIRCGGCGDEEKSQSCFVAW